MTPDRLPTVLTDEEFAGMMRDFDIAGHWMREQLALKRATPSAAALKHRKWQQTLVKQSTIITARRS